MTSMRITIDDAQARTAFQRLISAGGNLFAPLDEIGGYLVSATVRRFETETGPDGAKWKPSFRAQHAGGQTLSDTGRLKGSIHHQVGSNYVDVGTNVLYAAVHQMGATIRAKGGGKLTFNIPGIGWRSAESVTIPARPFLGVDSDDRMEIQAIVTDFVREAFQ